MNRLLFCLLLIPACLAAQGPAMFRLEDEYGVQLHTVYDLLVDREGFLWAASDRGLYRITSGGAEYYQHHEQRAREVTGLCQDKRGRIWCVNFSGQVMYVEGGRLYILRANENVQNQNWPRLALDRDSAMLYIARGPHLFRIDTRDPAMGHRPQFLEDEKVFEAPGLIHGVYIEKSGRLWINTSRGVATDISHPGQPVIYECDPYGFPGNASGVNPFEAFACELNGKTHALLRERESGSLVRLAGETFIPLAIPAEVSASKARFLFVKQTPGGEIWLATQNELWLLDSSLHTVQPYPLIPHNAVTDVEVDREDNFWFSTLGSGIFRMPRFENRLFAAPSCDFPTNRITEMEQMGEDTLLLGFGNGDVLFLDTRTGKTRALIRSAFDEPVHALHFSTRLDRVFAVNYDITELSRTGHTLRRLPGPLTSVKDLDTDRDGHLYIASSYDAYVRKSEINPALDGPEFNFSTMGMGPMNRLGTGRSFRVCADATGKGCWVLSNLGIFRYDGTGVKAVTDEGKAVYATGMAVRGEQVYFITARELWQWSDGHIQRLTVFADDTYLSSIALRGDTAYLVDKGRIIACPLTANARPVMASGLAVSQYVNDMLVSGNRLWLATNDGLQCFPLGAIRPVFPVLPVFISQVKVNDKPVEKAASVFDHRDNSMEFHFLTTGYRYPAETRFWCKLEGLDKDWISVSREAGSIRYPDLPAGDFVFKVMAVSGPGFDEGSLAAAYAFHIRAPFWQRWWFFASLVVLAGSALLVFTRLRLKRAEQKYEEALHMERMENEIRNSRLSALNSQMNPHFLFNALTSIQNLILQNKQHLASEFLHRFSLLMRKVLDMSRVEWVSLNEEIEALRLYLDIENARFDNSIHTEIMVDEALDPGYDRIPSMLVQPYVENAIKHGLFEKQGERRLLIRFDKTVSGLCITVEDNGIGRARAQELKGMKAPGHRSFAMKANTDRIELLNKRADMNIRLEIIDLQNTYNAPAGTRVVISLDTEPSGL